MNEEEIKNEMRLYVVEVLAANLLSALCLQHAPDDPAGAMTEILGQMKRGAQKQTFSRLDPAMSDLFAAELESAVVRFAAMANEQIGLILKYRSGTSGGS